MDKSRRKELAAEYQQARPAGGVCRIVHTASGRSLVSAVPNLATLKNRFDFASTTNSPSALDGRLAKDIAEFGLAAFSFEVLEELQPASDATPAEIRRDLATLEGLWREKIGTASLY